MDGGEEIYYEPRTHEKYTRAIYLYPFIVGALPHYIGENAHIFANIVQQLKVILSFYKPQIWICKAKISP